MDSPFKELKSKYPELEVVLLDTVDSTNTEARRRQDIKCGIIIARHQTAGRGRHGRSFYSPDKSGLYMSVILPITPMDAYEFSLTAAAAVAAVSAIEKVCKLSPLIKWVNDIYLGGKKVAGILTEADTCRVIVGIGINVSTTDFPADLPLAGSLGKEGISLDALAAEFALQLFNITESRDRSFMNIYRDKNMLLNTPITFEQNGNTFNGFALDIDEQGRLRVATENGEILLSSGEVHIVMQQTNNA